MSEDATSQEDQAQVQFERELKKTNGERSATAVSLAKADDRTIHDWLSSIGTTSQMRVTIIRQAPSMWRGRTIRGVVDFTDEPIDEEWLKNTHGGGKYQIKVQTLNAQGKYTYSGARTIEISGDPVLQGAADDSKTTPVNLGEDTSVTKAALSMTERLAEQAARRAEKLEDELRNKSGVDPAIFSVLEKSLSGDGMRLDAIRTAHEAELRTMREAARDDVKRAEDRLQRLLEQQEKAHERELSSLKASYENAAKTLEISYTTQIKTIEGQLATARSDLDAAKKELAELRAKKDQPIEEQIERFVTLRELFGALGGDAEEEPAWKQIMEGIMDSPVAQSLAKRIAEGPPEPGRVMSHRAAIAAKRAARARQAQAPQETKAPALGTIKLDPTEVATAVSFIEQAIRNETPPETFAQSVRALVPKNIVDVIQEVGIDQFFEEFAKVEEGSPISTVAGRNFIRKVLSFLET